MTHVKGDGKALSAAGVGPRDGSLTEAACVRPRDRRLARAGGSQESACDEDRRAKTKTISPCHPCLRSTRLRKRMIGGHMIHPDMSPSTTPEPSPPDLAHAVGVVIDSCLGVRPGEDVLVVTDPDRLSVARALRDGARRAGADAVLAVMDERATDGTEPPAPIAAALQAADVFIAPTSRSLSHTRARKQASEAGARGATMPGVTADMLARVMALDFDTMAARSQAVAELLDRASAARLTCPRGSDLHFDLTGRAGLPDDGRLSERGAFGNLPCGEGFIAPLGGEGVMVAASLAPLGLSDEPARLTVREGHIVDAEGGLGPAYLERLRAHGEAGTNLAELGVGTNDRAGLSGNVLEDEKILGTVHVAFGASAGIGGTVSVPIHLDAVVLDASLIVDGVVVLEAGRYTLGDA
jgi:leucyl aminopeptidase (aminopeptidase T)